MCLDDGHFDGYSLHESGSYVSQCKKQDARKGTVERQDLPKKLTKRLMGVVGRHSYDDYLLLYRNSFAYEWSC